MYIETDLGFGFSKYEDLVRYMKEENIPSVVISVTFPNWGVSVKKNEKYTFDELVCEVEKINSISNDM